MIRVEGLRKRFGGVVAVDEVSFEARDGMVTGLLGHNGAGKSTTLRMICGLLQPDAGRIHVDGADPVARPLEAQARIGALPDAAGLYARLTAREHIEYFGRLRGLPNDQLEANIDYWTRALGMENIIHRRAGGFSHGERTKVAMARALAHRPQNVILDEPTNGLDVMATRAVREVIATLSKEGRCVVFSSHVMQEVSALCHRIVVLARGRVVADGAPDEVREQAGEADLEDAFVALTGQKLEAV
ncbi:MAG: ATP-binding cassette domain-containing protein [Acidobacteria bacterium]|nr:ATP-binding cassette domain-containing protein [Acidobacteriota bacterium]